MPYLTKDDLKMNINIRDLDEITRADDDIVTQAINAAISMAKGYLSRFDLEKLFNPDSEGFIEDYNLKSKVIDLAAYIVIKRSNANVDWEIAQSLNKEAIAWLRDIQKGGCDPEGWPYKPNNPDTLFPEGNTVSCMSNPKRRQHF